MYSTITTLIDRLASRQLEGSPVIQWGAPVPCFGDVTHASVATLGLNPSNREFVDENGQELRGRARRFHTLRSLGLDSWTRVDGRHLELIAESCARYFDRNPYDRWFRRLDEVLADTGASFYGGSAAACHLDLIPYATSAKWTNIASRDRARLMETTRGVLASLLGEAPVRILILNGSSVARGFECLTGVQLHRVKMPGWVLRRRSSKDVWGVAYRGVVASIEGQPLDEPILAIGYNHNLQSSFGITHAVVRSIREWVGAQVTSWLS